MKVMVETSARHVHLSQEDLDTLFGKGYRLTNKKDLSQPGQFACEERVSVIGPKGEMKGVSILGPVRPASQVELSLTDARKIGIAAPIRESGDIAGTPGCKLVGPAAVSPDAPLISFLAGIVVPPDGCLIDDEKFFIAIPFRFCLTVFDDICLFRETFFYAFYTKSCDAAHCIQNAHPALPSHPFPLWQPCLPCKTPNIRF